MPEYESRSYSGFFVIVGVIMIMVAIAAGVMALSGAGKLQSMTTLGGIYAVEHPGNFEAVCFVNKDSGSMSCLPRSQVTK